MFLVCCLLINSQNVPTGMLFKKFYCYFLLDLLPLKTRMNIKNKCPFPTYIQSFNQSKRKKKEKRKSMSV